MSTDTNTGTRDTHGVNKPVNEPVNEQVNEQVAKSTSPYSDIMHQARPTSTRARMSMHDRAAQFMPFAAVVGFNDSVLAAQQKLKE